MSFEKLGYLSMPQFPSNVERHGYISLLECGHKGGAVHWPWDAWPVLGKDNSLTTEQVLSLVQQGCT